MKMLSRSGLTLALATACLAAHAEPPLPAGISGAWFDPSHPGHGLSVEILSNEHAIVFWYTYDHEGNPLSLYTEARIEGDTLVGTAFAPRGMRFRSFDPAELSVEEWGTLRLQFETCNYGHLDYDANDAAFGEGGFRLLRLTSIKDSNCVLGFPSRIATGTYEANIYNGGAPQESRTAVDADGVLHMVTFLRGTENLPAQPQEQFNHPLLVVRGTPQPPQAPLDRMARIALDIHNNTWFAGGAQSSSPRGMTLRVGETGSGSTEASVSGINAIGLRGPTATRALDPDLDFEALSGSYRFVVEGPLPTFYRVEVANDGELCVRADVVDASCWPGQAQLTSSGFFRFTLGDGVIVGTGWLEVDAADGTRTLVLAGDLNHPGAEGKTYGIVAESD